jgi:hypothetical protein
VTADARALAACLAAGHCLADFALQTSWMVERKHRASGLLAHGGVVAAATAVALLPFAGRDAALAAAALTGTHMVLDAFKSAIARRAPSRSLEWFVLDQLGHLGLLAAAWLWLAPKIPPVAAMHLDARALGTVALLVAAYAFNLNGMSAIVVAVLARLGMSAATEGDGAPPVGRVIGFLERVFALTLILLDRWEALGLLVAAKSLARFKELDVRARAEYYLVGTLVSLLGATLTALLVRALR